MRVVFAGSPNIAAPSLETLAGMKDVELAGVLTNPDTPKGRSGIPQPTEVGIAAEKIGVPILKPQKLDAQAREQISALKPDLLVSFAYGSFFGPKFMALFPLGGINIHPSLLPKYRGPTPIQTAILNRDSVTGITIQMLAQQMDSGDILSQEKLQLTGRETTASLSETVAVKAAQMLPDVLGKIAGGIVSGMPQNHSEASYCSLITKDDGKIDWNLSAVDIDAKIRSFDPWPLCRTIHKGLELFILKADVFRQECPTEGCGEKKSAGLVFCTDKQNGILIQTGNGILAVTELQFQNKKALFWKDFLNGAHDFIGSVLS